MEKQGIHKTDLEKVARTCVEEKKYRCIVKKMLDEIRKNRFSSCLPQHEKGSRALDFLEVYTKLSAKLENTKTKWQNFSQESIDSHSLRRYNALEVSNGKVSAPPQICR